MSLGVLLILRSMHTECVGDSYSITDCGSASVCVSLSLSFFYLGAYMYDLANEICPFKSFPFGHPDKTVAQGICKFEAIAQCFVGLQ